MKIFISILKSTTLIACLVIFLSGCTKTGINSNTEINQGPDHESITSPTKGNIYYVSPLGDDSASGQEQSPWQTVQKAADSVAPGDTVYISAGTYAEEIILNISGTADVPITFSAMPDEEVSFQGLELASGTSYLNITDLIVEDFSVWGVFLRGNNSHITLSGLTVKGGDAGFRLTWGYSGEAPIDGPVSNIVLKDSLIQGPLYTAVDCTPGPCDQMTFRNLEIHSAGLTGEDSYGADGIAVEKGQDVLVEDCYIHDNGGDGIDLNSRDTTGNISGIVVRRNRVVRNHKNGIKLWAGGRIENNIVWGQGDTAVWIGVYPSKYEVVNNTIAYNMWDPHYSGRNYAMVVAYPGEGSSPQIDLTLLNNIFAFNSNEAMGGPTGLYLGEGVNLVNEGYNLFWSREDNEIIANFVEGDSEVNRTEITDGTWTASTGQGVGDMAADPLFVAGWPNVDLHLQENSPAVNAGTSTGAPSSDLEGNSRPRGSAYDISAYER